MYVEAFFKMQDIKMQNDIKRDMCLRKLQHHLLKIPTNFSNNLIENYIGKIRINISYRFALCEAINLVSGLILLLYLYVFI